MVFWYSFSLCYHTHDVYSNFIHLVGIFNFLSHLQIPKVMNKLLLQNLKQFISNYESFKTDERKGGLKSGVAIFPCWFVWHDRVTPPELCFVKHCLQGLTQLLQIDFPCQLWGMICLSCLPFVPICASPYWGQDLFPSCLRLKQLLVFSPCDFSVWFHIHRE